MNTIRAILTAALLALVSAPARAQGTVDLRPKFEVGDQTRYTMELEAAMSVGTTGEQGAMRQTLKQEIGFTLKVKDARPEADATVDLVFDRYKLAAESPMGKMEFDSAQPADKDGANPLAAALRPIVGSTLTMTVAPDGTIKQITGGERLAALGQFAAQISDPKQAKRLFGQILTLHHGTGLARVGESWENVDALDMEMIGSFKMKTTHTLRSASGDDAVVDFKGTIEPASESPGEATAQIKEARFAGTYHWDTGDGELDRMTTDQTVVMDVKQLGQTRNEMKMKVTRAR